MVLHFTFPVLLLCFVFIMCGVGDAVRDLEVKYATHDFQKNFDFNRDDEGKSLKDIYYEGIERTPHYSDVVKSLEDMYYQGIERTAHDSDKMKSLKDKYYQGIERTAHDSDVLKNQEDIYYQDIERTAYDSEEVKSLNNIYYQGIERTTHDSKIMKLYHNHVESAKVGFFTHDELLALSAGRKLPIFFPIQNHSLHPPNFLPKQVADIIPFSSSQAYNILQFFSIPPNSPKAKAVQDTLEKCELEKAQGETKICATSLESLHGFLSNAFGPEVDFKSISTKHPTITTPIFQNYTVSEPPREIESSKIVACHSRPYLYAVYFCHYDATETKAFELRLVGDVTGDKVDALVVCHMGTSSWSFDHPAFRMLGNKHGDSVCHVFSQGNLIWIDQPSAIPVRAV